jgi:hypothetical protein
MATTASSFYPLQGIRAFSTAFQLAWMAAAAVTVTLEVIPAHFSPVVFYSYKTLKILLFLVVGYLTPLSFWRFDKMSFGFGFAAVSAALIELLQGVIGNGHKFSWIELLGKLALIGFGFIVALDARYERAILIGHLRLRLVGEHLPERH